MSSFAEKVNLDGFGEHLFKGAVAEPYLIKQGLSLTTLEPPYSWVTDGNADAVAAAVLEWATDRGASVYCHWFQPLAAAGLRHGQSAQVQMSMVEFDRKGKPVWDFKGKNILRGETDGSSYPNGGLRATHRAGAYLTVDPTSPIFLRGDTIFIPACFVAFTGQALDEKTPLLRAGDALSREGTRLLKLLGYEVKGLQSMIGLEQELFFIPRSAYLGRPDLQFTGRTIVGRLPARGQELSDHYMAPTSLASPVLPCMQEIQTQCFKMGIPLKTRHREVAPNQYEFAPMFGNVTTQIDQNLMVMQIIEEVSVKYGLAALLQEKPFQGVNGSGKHNNWSIGTDDGTNLFNVGQLAQRSGSTAIFPVIMAAVLKGINDFGDLMRLAIACPGNDFRLGACEAPPAIISAYLGESMTNYLESYMAGNDQPYVPATNLLNLGSSVLPPIELPIEDRNRTSPFPYGGHRFEFRAVGSSQNVSLVNTVLASMCAYAFKDFADKIEAGATPTAVAQEALKESWKNVFNGNGYDPANQAMLTEKGLWRIDSCVDAIDRFIEPKNIKLFSSLNVFTERECLARRDILLNYYIGVVEMEASCLVDMLNQHIIPSVKAANVGPLSELQAAVQTLQTALTGLHHIEDLKKKAESARTLRLETMLSIRATCDAAEAIVPANLWTLATYKDLLFVDMHHK